VAPLASVSIKDLTKRFGDVVAVNKLDLDVKDREFVVLLGPSGCGKTTALRCIAGLETPDEGEIYIGDRLVNDLDPKERDIAMVFQSYALYPHMKVFDNLAFPLENAKVPKAEIKNRVQEVAELLKIEELLNRKPKQLSGGQRQRVALGRAMVREPHVFLMDEPLSNLDAKLRVYMRAELKKLQKDVGITTIYVTHDQVEAMTMGDKIAILNEGILQQVGSSDKIYFHPSNVFVAGFIGTPPTNFFDCSLVRDHPYVLDAGEFKYSVPKHLLKTISKWPSDSFVLGVRPQDVIVHKDVKNKTDLVKARLDVIEPLGDKQILDLEVGDYLVKALVSPDFRAEIGDELWIEFSADKIYIFDKKTGETLT
jgi:multiple sugar transport system ATP-binding protein